jgi:hypothetical protein
MSFRLCVAALLLGVVGCGSSNYAKVSGRVTLDGRPLEGAHVIFQPIGQPGDLNSCSGSYAITQSDGSYSLKLVVGDAKGAVVGKHRVEISVRDGSNSAVLDLSMPKPIPKDKLPERYNNSSELTFDVPRGGTKVANFELESK